MGRTYGAVWNAVNTQSASIPIMTLTGAATVRAKLCEMDHGSDAVPADNAGSFLIRRHSTAPAGGTAITPAPWDPADPACASSAMMGPSIGAPTLGVSLFQFPLNQRATYRWIAAEGREIIIPAVANNGLSLLAVVTSGAAVNQSATWAFIE